MNRTIGSPWAMQQEPPLEELDQIEDMTDTPGQAEGTGIFSPQAAAFLDLMTGLGPVPMDERDKIDGILEALRAPWSDFNHLVRRQNNALVIAALPPVIERPSWWRLA